MDKEPITRFFHHSCVIGKTMFIYGGIHLTSKGQKRILNDLWAFSIRTGAWNEIVLNGIPRPRYSGNFFFYEDSFYIIGGISEKKQGSQSIDRLKPDKGILDKGFTCNVQQIENDDFFYFEMPSGNDIKDYSIIIEKNNYFYSIGGTINEIKFEKLLFKIKIPDNNNKILITGCSESGKNTLFKNFCLNYPLIENKIHGELYEQEIEFEKHVLYENIISTITSVTRFTKFQLEQSNPKIYKMILQIEDLKKNSLLADYILYTPEIALAVEEVWKDPTFQDDFQKKLFFDFNRGIYHLFNNLERYRNSQTLKLKNEDILHTFSRNIGYSSFKDERLIKLKGNSKNQKWTKEYKIMKIGGLRSERRKFFIKKSIESNCVLILVNLTNYLLDLFEDETVKRIDEDYSFLDEVLNQEDLQSKPIHLCFTMKDILPDVLLKYSDLKLADHYFKENHIKPNHHVSYSNFVDFMIWKFTKNIKRKRVYVHVISTVDSKDIQNLGELIHQSLNIDHYDTILSKISFVYGKEKPFTKFNQDSPFTDLIFK